MSESWWSDFLPVMITTMIILRIVSAFFDKNALRSTSEETTKSPSPQPSSSFNDAMIVGIVEGIGRLEAEKQERENQWMLSVIARHFEWTLETRQAQLAILIAKWEGARHQAEGDVVRAMKCFGEQGYALAGIKVELLDEDYRDIHWAKSANIVADWEIQRLRTGLNS